MEIEIADKLPTGKYGHHTPDSLALLDAMEKLKEGKYLQIKNVSSSKAESLRQLAYRRRFSFHRHKVDADKELFDIYFWKEKK